MAAACTGASASAARGDKLAARCCTLLMLLVPLVVTNPLVPERNALEEAGACEAGVALTAKRVERLVGPCWLATRAVGWLIRVRTCIFAELLVKKEKKDCGCYRFRTGSETIKIVGRQLVVKRPRSH
mmetsp:Transcript_20982/g.35200  ORF Transcript_20982/g.35200 Transcript_20982/m.35200 type:complete len:127 (+) Transcript_20982:1486-1866(+)